VVKTPAIATVAVHLTQEASSMSPFSRRNVLSFSAAGAVATVASVANAATFGNPDSPPEGAVNASPGAQRDPGPQNPALASQFPAAVNPPATDVGDLPQFWASFNNAHKRIQGGGWARQVTQADFAISEEISGVNMRLAAGGIREMHWHLASEWAYMTNGQCRITVLDQNGHAYVQDVEEGDLWFFPAGMPHSLQGIGPDGCEFLIVFDDGKASEFNTLLVTDWIAHTPPEVLATNFAVPADTFKSTPMDDLWIFQGKEPGALSNDQQAVQAGGEPPFPFTFKMGASTPRKSNRSGMIQIVDSNTFKVSTTTSAALITLKPGALREMHWHPNADEWQYWIKGEGQMGVFKAGPNVQTQSFRSGDVGYIPRNQGHYIRNTGTTDLQFLAVFRAPEYQEISLSEWLVRTPPALVAQHFNIDATVLAQFPQNAPGILPE
jgi:oxalate decarboxylase